MFFFFCFFPDNYRKLALNPPSPIGLGSLPIRDKTPREEMGMFQMRYSLFKLSYWISLTGIRNFVNIPYLLSLFAVETVISVEIPDGGFNESLRYFV